MECALPHKGLGVHVVQAVRNVLTQAYGRKEAVTDELVEAILQPGLAPGAVDVFLDFISYSGGPVRKQPHNLLSFVAPCSFAKCLLHFGGGQCSTSCNRPTLFLPRQLAHGAGPAVCDQNL
eukprot:scaffold21561_cov16-Tisochrysis_lutea.AAC.1